MKAIVQDHYGHASLLRFDDIDRPQVPDDKVLVQVVAAGVDRGAIHFMTGQPYLMRLGTGLRTPKVRVPGGRARLLRRYGAFTAAIALAPFEE